MTLQRLSPPTSVSAVSAVQHFSTLAIHAGLEPDPTTGAILTPIHQSSTYVVEKVGVSKGYTYSRSSNPTVSALERNLAALDGARGALACSSGLSALTVLLLSLVKSGERVIVSDVVYGGTARLLRNVLSGLGVRADFVDTSALDQVQRALREPAKLVLIETPANPTLKLTDVESVAELAHAAGTLLAVDNTFLTPFAQRVFELGADVAVYSTTKHIEGHNSTIGGALLAQDAQLLERFAWTRNAIGAIQAPFQAWLTLRGSKTLALRLERHAENALRIARYLEAHALVEHVAYPFLESFPQHALARRQQKNGGGLISFTLRGGTRPSLKLLESTRLCALAENLGAVESLITHPASMTHAALSPEERQRLGISDGLVRLSVGLEDPEDLIADLEQALERAEGA
jgi:cystathionine beta-lyase/cystathionine gamma-synthase